MSLAIQATTKEKNTMTLPNDKGIIFYSNGFVRTHDKNGKLLEPTYPYIDYPIPGKSKDSDKSRDKLEEDK